MKPADIFSAILKAAGVVFWVYAIEGLPTAIRYSPFFYQVESQTVEISASMNTYMNTYWKLSLVHSVIYLVCGSLLVFGTKLFVRLAYGSDVATEPGTQPSLTSDDIAN
jgi:hypothetical protein